MQSNSKHAKDFHIREKSGLTTRGTSGVMDQSLFTMPPLGISSETWSPSNSNGRLVPSIASFRCSHTACRLGVQLALVQLKCNHEQQVLVPPTYSTADIQFCSHHKVNLPKRKLATSIVEASAVVWVFIRCLLLLVTSKK